MNYSLNEFPEFATTIMQRLDHLEKMIAKRDEPAEEWIDRKTLCERLDISVPTVIRMEKKNIIPFSRKGMRALYDWKKVTLALEKK